MDKTEFAAAVLAAEPTLYCVTRSMLPCEADCAAAHFTGEPDESLPAPEPERYDELYAALYSLDEKYRLPVTLHYLEGFKLSEIAAMLRLPQGTVATRLRRARELLREKLKGEYCV